MMSLYVDFPRLSPALQKTSPDDLTIAKARATAEVIISGAMNWVEIVACYRHASACDDAKIVAETVVFTVEVELPQHLAFAIERFERVAVTFKPDDTRYPNVYALRGNFPEVAHLNLESFELPRSLCLYDKSYAEVKLTWTATAFVERIRNWLADTALGTLHKAGQPLEPLVVGADAFIILPRDILSDSGSTALAKIKMRLNQWDDRRLCFAAHKATDSEGQKDLIFSILSVKGRPQLHGRIRHKPGNLLQLHEFLQSAETNLLEYLRSTFRAIDRDRQTLLSGLILLIELPKTRNEDEAAETSDVWAFVCLKDKGDDNGIFYNLAEVGSEIGIWEIRNNQVGWLLSVDESKTGENVKLLMLAPCFDFSRANAPVWSGTRKRMSCRIAAVGMGALGSQVFLNLIRTADGEWTTIDKDILLPHNLVRHAAYGAARGFAKAELAAIVANNTVEEPIIAKAIVADILEPGNQAEAIAQAFGEAEIILDFSASIAVARHLALDVDARAKRISLFLNPAGNDLVLLAEDAERHVPLDSLEMQYYRLIINDLGLNGHLVPPAGQIRFSTSCREVSNQILPESVALCAAVGTSALRQVLTEDSAALIVWRKMEGGEVKRFSVEPAPVVTSAVKDWTITTDGYLLAKVMARRKESLPLETGGVLIGSYDMQRKIIYVAEMLPAPADSVERETHFIRGSYGLKPQIEAIQEATLGNLQYIGEWHSHPPKCSSNPSQDDKKLLTSLAAAQCKDGNPALILIVGEESVSWYVA
jgi:integrative and conjugative element protein (TIGR02256 family)